MRLLGFLYRKKKIALSSRNSVHPASNGQEDLYRVKGAKIKEILGIITPKECREVDDLLNKMSQQVQPSYVGADDAYDDDDEEDKESADTDLVVKVEESCNDGFSEEQYKGRSKSDLQVSTAEAEMAANKPGQSPLKSPHNKPVTREFVTRKPCSMDMTMKSFVLQTLPCRPGSLDLTMKADVLQLAAKASVSQQSVEDVTSTRKLCGATDLTVKTSPAQGSARKYRQLRPPKLTCVNDKAAELSRRNGLGSTSEHSNGHHYDRIKRKKSASCHGSFPLPPPFACEKHYLPTPPTGATEYMKCVGYPLPQLRPSTPMRAPNGCVLEQFADRGHGCVLEQFADRGQIKIARAMTCDSVGKSHLRNKEYISVLHTKSLDPSKHLISKQKASQSTMEGAGFPVVPTQRLKSTPCLQSIVGGGFPVPIQGLKSTPPTPSCLQSNQNPQTPQGTPTTMTSLKQHHQTIQGPLSTPTTMRPHTHQLPQTTLSRSTGMEPPQTPQSTPPRTPRAHHYSSLHMPQSLPSASPLLQSHQPPRKSISTATGTELHSTPPITPPTTPGRQNHPTDQVLQSKSLASPRSLYHQGPQNMRSMATNIKLHETSENTPPTTPRQEYHHTLHNVTQAFAGVTGELRSPPPSSRKSPMLTSSYRQSPPHFPSSHAQSPPCSPLSRSLCPRKWEKGVMLGQGSFGAVHEGLNSEDGSFFAVKISNREDTFPEIQQEVEVLSKLEHPNIVRYFGSSIVDNRLCIFLELVGMGSLESLLRKYKRFEEGNIRSYTRQILLGLEYLHGKKTIHRDIKCGNILAEVNGQVKLSDFGIAKQIDESLASSLKGTPLYMAPEVLVPLKDSKSSYSFPADIWSLGCTVFELADGKPPWSNLQGFGFFFKVKNGELPPMPENLSPVGQDFIRTCLQFHPEDRPTASELLQHPFVLNAPTPEPLLPLSPSSPLSPKLWQAASPHNSSSWACGHCCPSSPIQDTCFDRMSGSPHRVQMLIQGR